ncbi:DUF6712 family protein [Dysgonomonas termitidis]|uniref:DUF6712 family protein n=1 Tax=Dysgonomonas termitidis TaxID=1516126 RepID=A0ABV9L1T3_9BACT
MIFSENKWSDGDELRPYIPISTSLSFRNMNPAFQNAFGLFIRPVMGNAVVERLQEIYDAVVDISIIREDTDDKEIKLLYYGQRANAFLAYWYDYDELQVLIGDAGIKRQDSEKTKTPYKYQEHSLKEGFKQKGFDALDNLIAYLEENTDEFPEYLDSENYTRTKDAIVRSTQEVNGYYPVNNSRLVFLRLKPAFRVIEDTVIAPRLGAILYNEFKEALMQDSPDEKYLKLREKLLPVVVFYGVRKLILETGSLTDRGLFFTSLKGGDGSYMSLDPVADNRIAMQADKAEADAISYWLLAEQYLKTAFGIPPSNAKKIPNRDNNGKKSFWA